MTFHGRSGDGYFSETTHFTIVHFDFFLVMRGLEITYLIQKATLCSKQVQFYNFLKTILIDRQPQMLQV